MNYDIIHSNEREYINAIFGAVIKSAAERGKGDKLKERYKDFHKGNESDNAAAGFFAMIDGVLIGGITYHLHNDWVFIHSGYVWEQYRGMGVYSALMECIEDALRSQGYLGMFVSTYEFEAPEIYEHLGFTKGSVLTNCPTGNTSIDYYKDFGKDV